MIYVYIKKDLEKFETDIRELCLTFFTLQKITYVYKGKENDIKIEDKDIIVKDYFSGDIEGSKTKVKSELKRQLYNYLSELTGKKLLWGTLTGIRPTTIITKMIEEKSENNILNDELYDNIKKDFKRNYYTSDLKTDELIEIAKNEIEILHRPNILNYKEGYSIYIGVPFCKSTCLYCSFTSFNIDKFKNYVDKYLHALENEFEKRVNDISSKYKSNVRNKLNPLTIYIGGGTPTSLDYSSFKKLLDIVDKYIDRSNCIEYTVEAGRPDTIDEEKLSIMKQKGVNRISINPQSFNQKTLDLIGRKHRVEDIIEKFNLARKVGFDNINMDIILGLPNEHLFELFKTLNGIRKLKPDSFTVHSLALKRAARLNYELESWTKNYYLAGLGKKYIVNGEVYFKNRAEGKREIDSMLYFSDLLARHLKLKPYYMYRQKNMAGNLENIGYALDGKECVYNIMMMSERHSVYGFGTATTKEVFYEKDGSKRIESSEGYKSVIDYCKNILG